MVGPCNLAGTIWRGRSGQWALWVMDADGGNQRLLALLPGPVDGRVQFEPDYLNHGWLEEQIAWSW